jgi:SAM-dependent methyltransferase
MTYPPPEALQIACERFDRSATSFFDYELDEIVCAGALERKSVHGYYNVAGTAARFTVASGVFREDLWSDASRSIGRHRSIVCALSTVVFGAAGWPLPRVVAELNDRRWSVYLAERNTPLFEYFAAHMDTGRFTFSEYCGDGLRSGDVVDGIRHEDLQATSFPDAAFDLVITSEVLEHVPHAPQAEREIMRILRPGGSYVFTVPLDAYGDADTILAELLPDGTVKFYGPPVYHGDPYRPEGILAYRIFSVADLERRFAAAGGDCVTWRFWSKMLGILGGDSWVHVVSKP